jgi:cardiolipin synthase
MTTWNLYRTSEESWNSLFADCLSATKTIDVELYGFNPEGIGQKFIDLCKDKVRSGVKIRLLFDMVGSRYFFSSPIVTELRNMGIEIRFFNPAYIFRFNRFIENFFRTHRKIVIIDREIAHLGGVNLIESMRHWRDTNIRFTGDLVMEAYMSLEYMWNLSKQKRIRSVLRVPTFVKDFAIRTNAPRRHQRFLYRELIEVLRNARKSVYITTPYFVPDFRFFRVLRLLAKRGVDVQLLVPASSDHRVVDLATQSHFSLLLKAGVKIHQYTGGMMHAKTVVVDDTWATVGSFNMDNLSFLFNYEANVVTQQKELIETLRQDFLQDVMHAQVVISKQWYSRSLVRKILEICTWPIHQLL